MTINPVAIRNGLLRALDEVTDEDDPPMSAFIRERFAFVAVELALRPALAARWSEVIRWEIDGPAAADPAATVDARDLPHPPIPHVPGRTLTDADLDALALRWAVMYPPPQATGVPAADQRPHSRACGIRPHDHGPACSSDCPTCGGRS